MPLSIFDFDISGPGSNNQSNYVQVKLLSILKKCLGDIFKSGEFWDKFCIKDLGWVCKAGMGKSWVFLGQGWLSNCYLRVMSVIVVLGKKL